MSNHNRYNLDLNIEAYRYIIEGICESSFVNDMCEKYSNTSQQFVLFCSDVYREQKQAFENSNY